MAEIDLVSINVAKILETSTSMFDGAVSDRHMLKEIGRMLEAQQRQIDFMADKVVRMERALIMLDQAERRDQIALLAKLNEILGKQGTDVWADSVSVTVSQKEGMKDASQSSHPRNRSSDVHPARKPRQVSGRKR